MTPAPQFTENAAASRAGAYAVLTVDTGRVLASWRDSVFAFEWLRPDGQVKAQDELPPGERAKGAAVEAKLAAGEPLDMPVLGIGLMDNVEIGAGRAVLLTLARLGVRQLPVHVPKGHLADFKAFAA